MKRISNRIRIPAALAALSLALTVIAGNTLAMLLREATGADDEIAKDTDFRGQEMIDLVNDLLDKGLILAAILCPLTCAWGAGMMMFSTRGSGPQVMAASIVAVVLVAGMKGIAS